MADELELGIRITADGKGVVTGVRRTERELSKLEQSTRRAGKAAKQSGQGMRDLGSDLKAAQKQSQSLTRSATRLGAVIGVSLGSVFASVNLVDTIRQGEILEASLKTMTGSAEAAGIAFRELEDFASETPFAIEQVVEAFIKLKAFGLDPSKEAIESYGNTASALGKDLQQMIEAVADAATGEFERLKEFGIKAAVEGDKVAFTFRGTTTTVKKSAEDIEKFLINIGNTDFAGATAERAQTLDGALSNLGDSFGSLARALGKAGLSESFANTAKSVASLAKGITALVTGRGATELPRWAKITGFAMKAIKAQIVGLGDAFGALAAVSAAVLSLEFSRAQEILRLHQESRRARERELEEYVATLEGLGQRIEQTDIDPFKNDKPSASAEAPDQTVQKRIAAINKEIAALERESAVFGLSRKEVALYDLALKGASQSQLARAEIALNNIDAEHDFAEAVRASEEAVRAENEAQAQWNTDQRESAEIIRDLIDPTREYRRELEDLKLLLDGGFLNPDEFEQRAAQIRKEMEGLGKTTNEMTEFTVQAARNMQSAFADFLFDPFKSGLRGMLSGLADTLRRMASELLSQTLLRSFFKSLSGVTGGSLSAVFSSLATGVAHQGGMVGGSLPTRQTSPLVFAGAARFHDGGFPGLARNEVPIIAQRGEEVLSRDDPRNAANGGGSNDGGVRIVNVLDPSLVENFLNSPQGERIIVNRMAENRHLLQAT